MPLDLLPPPTRPLPDTQETAAELPSLAATPVTEVRVLTPEEVDKYCAQAYEAAGAVKPHPGISTTLGVVRDGVPTGSFLVLQFCLHAQPLNLLQGDEGMFLALATKAEQLVLEKFGGAVVYVFATPGKISRMAQAIGMSPEPWTVLSMVVAPESTDSPKEPVQ
jgi:hypothetical protein